MAFKKYNFYQLLKFLIVTSYNLAGFKAFALYTFCLLLKDLREKSTFGVKVLVIQ